MLDAHEARRHMPAPERAWFEVKIAQRLRETDCWVVLAREKSELVGVAHGAPAIDADDRPIPRLLHLAMIAVDPLRWGTGIGRALVWEALHEAARRGYREVQLWTQTDNAHAQRLYRLSGFRPTGETECDAYGESLERFVLRLPE